MTNQPNNTVSPLNQKTAVLLGILVAVIFLAGMGVAYLIFSGPSTPTPVAGNTAEAENWPTAPATFTPTISPTPQGTPIPTQTPTSTPTPVPTPTPTPIPISWRELGYLTTAEFTAVTVVEFTRERKLLPDENIILKAVGKIQAGIDMSAIEDTDVNVSGTTVEIVLPRAQVTSVELLEGETQIIDNGLLPGEGLETAALDKARQDLKQWAAGEGNLLDLSEKFGRLQLDSFLRQLGFKEITITFKDKRGI